VVDPAVLAAQTETSPNNGGTSNVDRRIGRQTSGFARRGVITPPTQPVSPRSCPRTGTIPLSTWTIVLPQRASSFMSAGSAQARDLTRHLRVMGAKPRPPRRNSSFPMRAA
jgi:hypothetical protein